MRNKLRDPPGLPELSGVKLLGRICLHPTKSSLRQGTKLLKKNADKDEATEISAQPPSAARLYDETRGRRRHLGDRFSRFLLSHCGDRPWRREEGELPLWNPNAALSNKAAILTAKIASEFCEWYRGLGGTAVIDEDKIQALFDINFPEPARSSTRVQVRELQSNEVPEHVLEAASKHFGLTFAPPPSPKVERELIKVAFGRCVPRSPRSDRPQNRAPPLPQPPEGLLSMDTVFRDIKHLQATQGFCQALQESPAGVLKPQCLVDANLVTALPVVKHRDKKSNKRRHTVANIPPWLDFK